MKIAVWNIGHFSGGNGMKTAVPEEKLSEATAAFRGYIDEIGADVIGICEYSYMFCNSDRILNLGPVYARDALFGGYSFGYEGPQHRYSGNALFAKCEVEGLRKKLFACNADAVISHTDLIKAADYYYVRATVKIDGKPVTLILAHLAFDMNLNPDTLNEAQIGELVEVLKEEERAVVIGDFNCKSFDSYRLFKEAGYTLAGDGSFNTCPTASQNHALDNIIVKGLKVENARVHETTLSDHYAFSADVSL